MILKDVIEKSIIRGEKLSEEERITLLDFFMRAEKSTTNPVTGTISNPSQSDITAMVEVAIVSNARTFFPRVSDITNHIGLQSAGEFRVGNGQVPGDGFTGGRFGWPGFEYGADTYFLVGVADDVLQVGLSLTDGKVYAGAGGVVLDSTGITAVAGTIGGWVIGTDYLQSADNQTGFSSAVSGSNDLRIWAGGLPGLAPFMVFEDGHMYAEDVEIAGTISSSSGTIGGWNITDFTIEGMDGDVGIRLAAIGTKIEVGDTAGTYIIIDGANQRIRSSNFVTGSTGFNIAADTGDAEFNNITARGELKTFLLTSSNQMAVAGNIIVSKDAGKLGADVTAIATTVNFGKAMTPGDWIKIQGPDSAGSAALEAMLVGSLVSGTTYNVTRNVDGSGANAWLKDTPFVVIGQSGDSRIELTAGASGSLQLITQGAAYGTTTTQVSLSTTAGAVTAGAGNVLINASGIAMANSATSWFNFKDSAGNIGVINIAADPNNDLEIVNIATAGTAGTISMFTKDSGGTIRRILRATGDTLVRLEVGADHYFPTRYSSNKTGYWNEANEDMDFVFEGDTAAINLISDAGLDAIGIGGAAESGKKLKVTGDTSLDGALIINDSGADKDTVIEGDTDTSLTIWDAGLDAIGMGGAAVSGQKLTLYGGLHINESGADVDSHIETDNQTAALYIDAGLDKATSFLWDGWGQRDETWTRTGNHTFTVSGDVTAIFRKGAKVRYKDGGSYEYGVVYSSSHAAGTTTVTLITNTDYTMAAATITDRYISYIENPEGFPHYFNWDAAPAGFSSVPTSQTYRWHTKGRTIFCEYIELTNGTSNATTFTATGPCNPAQGVATVAGTLVDNGAIRTVAGRVTMSAGSTAIAFRTDMSTGAWTNANGKRAVAYWSYEF